MAYSYSFEGPKWGSTAVGAPGGMVTWSFGQGTGKAVTWANNSINNFNAIVTAAFDRWEQVANIDFVKVADSSAVNIRLGTFSIDGLNSIVGVAYYSYSGSALRWSEIGFDSAENWNDTLLYQVALHEIGHAIGLDHHSGDPSIMAAYINPAITDLQPYDIAAIQALYGPANAAPIVVASNLQEVLGAPAPRLSDQLAYSDNDPAVLWRIQDLSNDGSSALILNSQALQASSTIVLTAAQFSQVTIATVGATHDIWARAFDGHSYSAPVHFTITPPVRPVPVVAVSDLVETLGMAPVALSAQLAYSGSLPAVTWRIQDISSNGESALLLNGSPLSAASTITLTAAQFAQVTIGTVTESHEIWANASDGSLKSAPVNFSITPPTNSAPVVTATDLHETLGAPPTLVSSQVTYIDESPAMSWRIQDISTDGTSALLLNGSPLNASQTVALTPAQFAALTIGQVTSSHDVYVVASDGFKFSAPAHFTITPPVNSAPVLVATDLHEVAGAPPVALSTQVSYSDAQAAVSWRIQDISSDGSTALLLNGSPLSAASTVTLTAAQFAQITIAQVNSVHEIWMRASDGYLNSAPVKLTVTPPGSHLQAGLEIHSDHFHFAELGQQQPMETIVSHSYGGIDLHESDAPVHAAHELLPDIGFDAFTPLNLPRSQLHADDFLFAHI